MIEPASTVFRQLGLSQAVPNDFVVPTILMIGSYESHSRA